MTGYLYKTDAELEREATSHPDLSVRVGAQRELSARYDAQAAHTRAAMAERAIRAGIAGGGFRSGF